MRASLDNLALRARAMAAIRHWFGGRGYLEVETPVRIAAPAPEPHIDCPRSGDAWLRASPELQMKRLMADWRVVTVREAYLHYAGWDPLENFDQDRFDEDMALKVEPALPKDAPCVLYGYPRQAASLARLSPEDGRVAERWELYLCGIEVANAFCELADGAEQRRRFEEARRERRALGEDDYPLDEGFLGDLERGEFPPCGGIAVGIDRIAMLLCGADSIAEVMAAW